MFAAKNELFTRPSGGFVIPRSLRFRASATAYLNRTVATTGDRQKATYSAWIKRGSLDVGTNKGLLVGDDGTGSRDFIRFVASDDTLAITLNENVSALLITTQVFRDTSAWYHIVLAIDTTQATAANRMKLYVNGVQVTAFGTANYPTQNYNFIAWNVSGKVQNLGASSIGGAGQLFDGYMAEVYWIDGQQLTPTSFGATNTITGVWSPINYGGSYGTNGYHLTFNSYATQAALGTDTSGNSNTWTVNGCSVTAGVTYDSMIDVPTVTDTGSNYATLNGTIPTGTTYGQGNLFCSGATQVGGYSSVAMTTGKFYAEVIFATGSNANQVGICNVTAASTDPTSAPANVSGYGNVGYYASTGQKFINTTNSAYGASYTTGDIIGIEVDMDNNTVQFFKNGTSQGTISTTINTIPKVFWSGNLSPAAHSENWNFGQTAFNRTPTAGFVGLNTYNLAAASILKGNLYMDATLYTGTGTSLGVTNAGGFQPDWVWTKSRSAATDHKLTDSVRGVTKAVISNTTGAETTDTQGLTAFNAGGFTVGTNTDYNNLAATYVGWQWKGGGAAVSNTSGTITSSVSASTVAGQSIVTYTGNGSNGASIGHGLGVTPQLVLFKDRSGAVAWIVYHVSLGSNTYLTLNNTTAGATATGFCTPSSSLITFTTTYGNTNSSGDTYVAYCFAPIAGYSAFGSYTGNASADGPFIYLGFRPRYVLFKNSSSAVSWNIFDTARDPYNVATHYLGSSNANVEGIFTTFDMLSNGFKIRTTDADTNGSGSTITYAAFAENPFNNSLAR